MLLIIIGAITILLLRNFGYTKHFALVGCLLLSLSASAATTYYWTGGDGSTSDWSSPKNWRTATANPATAVPDSLDAVEIGTLYSFTVNPSVSGTSKCATLTTGTLSNFSITSTGNLRILGAMICNPVSTTILSNITITVTLAGSGTISAGSVAVGNNSTFLALLTNNTLNLVSTVANFKIGTGGVSIQSTSATLGAILAIIYSYNNAVFSIQGGNTTIAGQITTANTGKAIVSLGAIPSAIAKLSVDIVSGSNPTLTLTNATPLSSNVIAGSVDFYNVVSGTGTTTVNYAGASQTVYDVLTSGNIIDTSPTIYDNLIFSGTGVAAPVSGGTINITGDFTNTMNNDATNYPNLVSVPVIFTSTGAQTLKGGSGNGTIFGNVTFTAASGSPVKTMSTGLFSVSSTGILNINGCTLAAGSNLLTLKSDASGSASLAQITSGSITGTVNVQRYAGGGSLSERNYRYMADPVYQNTVAGTNYFGFQDLQKTTIITGWGVTGTYSSTTPPTNAFDLSPTGNPSLFFYYEPDTDPTTRAIVKSDYKGLNAITDQFPVGNGFLFFFRGDRNPLGTNSVNKLSTGAIPQNTTLNFSGTPNQGTINVQIPTNPLITSSFTTAKVYSTSAAQATLSTNFGYTNTGSLADGGHLVGNPYACTIDLEKITLNNPGSTAIYMINNAGVISAYTRGSNSNSLLNGIGRFVSSGQGFFVFAKSTGTTSLTFTEACKTTSPSSVSTTFAVEKSRELAIASPSGGATANPQEVFIKLGLDTNDFTANETCIRFGAGKNNQFDPMEDASYQYGLSQTIYMASYTSDNKMCIINQMSTLDSIKTIPLFAEGSTSQLHKMTFRGFNSIDPRYKIYLKDNFMKDSLDLSANNVYHFNIDLNNTQTYGASRFALVVVPTNIASYYHLQSFTGTKVTTGVQLNWKTQYEGNYTTFTVQRSTDGGKTFSDLATMQSDSSGSYSYIDIKPVTGITDYYQLKQNNINNVNSFSKIVPISFQSITNIANNLTVYPNPTVNTIRMNVNDAGSSPLSVKIYSMSGNLMMSSSVSGSTTVSQDVSRLEKGTYVVQVTDNSKVYAVGKFTKL